MHVQADEDMTKSTDLDAAYSGTTACMSLVHNGRVYTANVGDSGACLGRLGPTGRIQAVELSKYARPSEPQVWLSASTTQHYRVDWVMQIHLFSVSELHLSSLQQGMWFEHRPPPAPLPGVQWQACWGHRTAHARSVCLGSCYTSRWCKACLAGGQADRGGRRPGDAAQQARHLTVQSVHGRRPGGSRRRAAR